MKIPNGDRAELGTKVEDYCLNSSHRRGQHKAHLFQSILGISQTNGQILRDALKRIARDSEDAVYRGNNGFGEVYELRFSLATDSGTATVLSAWIIRKSEDFPRLITCFIV